MKKIVSLRVRKGRYRPEVACVDVSRAAKQSFGAEVDINNIMKRFQVTGELPNRKEVPMYADVSRVPGYHESQELLLRANRIYQSMPADLKAELLKDPRKFFQDNLGPAKPVVAPSPASAVSSEGSEGSPKEGKPKATPKPSKPSGSPSSEASSE